MSSQCCLRAMPIERGTGYPQCVTAVETHTSCMSCEVSCQMIVNALGSAIRRSRPSTRCIRGPPNADVYSNPFRRMDGKVNDRNSQLSSCISRAIHVSEPRLRGLMPPNYSTMAHSSRCQRTLNFTSPTQNAQKELQSAKKFSETFWFARNRTLSVLHLAIPPQSLPQHAPCTSDTISQTHSARGPATITQG